MPHQLPAQSDPRGDWRTWSTSHFRIHARAEHASPALTAAAEAERAYAALSTELRPPRGPVDVVLYDNVDFPNGFANVFPNRLITIYLNPPAGEIGLSRYDEWLRLVITHELTHVFHLDRAEGVWGGLQRVFGRAPLLFPILYRPAWVGEGLATYYESRFSAGGRERGFFHSQLLAAATRSFPNPGDVNLSNSSWPGGLGPYAWGSRFFLWEATAHGDSVVPRFVDHTSRRLWPFTISGPLEDAGGAGLYPDWKGFRESWQARESSPSNRTVILAGGSRFEPHPRLSADGQRLAFVESDGKNQERVMVREVASGRIVASHRINGAAELAWQGSDLIIAQLDWANPVEIRSTLHRWTPGGGSRRIGPLTRLTRPFDLGGSIGAIKLGPALTTVIQIAGDSAETIAVPEGDAWSHLALSPDGRYLAAARHLHQQWDIVVWPVGVPSQVEMITHDEALDDDPAWSADGKTLAFTSERAGLPQIFGYDLSTRVVSQLTDEPTGAREGDLAPDGTIFFSTVAADGYAVASRRPGDVRPKIRRALETPVVLQPIPVSVEPRQYSPWPSLAPKYWLPLFEDLGTVGRFAGVATSGSDVVGRISYAAGIGADVSDFQSGRWEGLFNLSYTRWSALSLNLIAQRYWRLAGHRTFSPTAIGIPVSERNSSVTAGATIRRRRWRSDVSLRVGAELNQDAFFVPEAFNFSYTNPAFGGGVANFSARYTHQQALSISPEDGFQLEGLYRHRWVTSGSGWSNEVRGTLRGFLGLGLPGFSRWVLAGKITGVMTGGPLAKNYALGGQSANLYGALGFGESPRDLGLRGYPRDVARFTRLVTTGAELRIPLFLVGKGIWRLPLAVDKVSLSLFGETAGGWTATVGLRDVAQYRDVGGELVFDLGMNLDSPIRLRVGAAQSLTTGLGAAANEWRGYVAIGSAF